MRRKYQLMVGDFACFAWYKLNINVTASCRINLNKDQKYSFSSLHAERAKNRKKEPFLETKNTAGGVKKGGAKLKRADVHFSSISSEFSVAFDLSDWADSSEADARTCYV